MIVIKPVFFQQVLNQVALKFASSHYTRGVQHHNVRQLTHILIDHIQKNTNSSENIVLAYRRFIFNFINLFILIFLWNKLFSTCI